jgi:hypothetical protein
MLEGEVIAALTLMAKSLARIALALEKHNELLTPAEVPTEDESEIEEPSLYRSNPAVQVEQTGAGETDRANPSSTWGGRIERNLEAIKSRPRG